MASIVQRARTAPARVRPLRVLNGIRGREAPGERDAEHGSRPRPQSSSRSAPSPARPTPCPRGLSCTASRARRRTRRWRQPAAGPSRMHGEPQRSSSAPARGPASGRRREVDSGLALRSAPPSAIRPSRSWRGRVQLPLSDLEAALGLRRGPALHPFPALRRPLELEVRPPRAAWRARAGALRQARNVASSRAWSNPSVARGPFRDVLDSHGVTLSATPRPL